MGLIEDIFNPIGGGIVGIINYGIGLVQYVFNVPLNFITESIFNIITPILDTLTTISATFLSPLSSFLGYSMDIFSILIALVPIIIAMLYYVLTHLYTILLWSEIIIMSFGMAIGDFRSKNEFVYNCNKEIAMFILNTPKYLGKLFSIFAKSIEILIRVYQFLESWLYLLWWWYNMSGGFNRNK